MKMEIFFALGKHFFFTKSMWYCFSLIYFIKEN